MSRFVDRFSDWLLYHNLWGGLRPTMVQYAISYSCYGVLIVPRSQLIWYAVSSVIFLTVAYGFVFRWARQAEPTPTEHQKALAIAFAPPIGLVAPFFVGWWLTRKASNWVSKHPSLTIRLCLIGLVIAGLVALWLGIFWTVTLWFVVFVAGGIGLFILDTVRMTGVEVRRQTQK